MNHSLSPTLAILTTVTLFGTAGALPLLVAAGLAFTAVNVTFYLAISLMSVAGCFMLSWDGGAWLRLSPGVLTGPAHGKFATH